jgi:hypothetical protein
MSYDLFVLSPREEVLTTEQLREDLRNQGWELRFLVGGASFKSHPQYMPPESAGLAASPLLAGWRTNHPKADVLDQFFEQGLNDRLEKLFMEEDAFSTCGFSLTAPFHFDAEDTGFDSPDEWRRVVGRKVADFYPIIRSQYSLHTRGASLVTGFPFVQAVWQSLGFLSEGLLEDPQTGKNHRVVEKTNIFGHKKRKFEKF